MKKTPVNAVAIAEPNPKERTLGLIGGMLNGHIKEFRHEGLRIRQVGESIEVADEQERSLGGAMLIKSASPKDVYDWIEAKADLYE